MERDEFSLVGKKCKILFEDNGRVLPRIATIKGETGNFLIFENEYGIECFPIHKIVRVEVCR